MKNPVMLCLLIATIVGCKTMDSVDSFLTVNQIDLVVYKTRAGRTNMVVVEELLTGDIREFLLPDAYSLYEIISHDGNNLVISFQKMDGYDVLYSGILLYSIESGTVNELFRSELQNFIDFRLVKSDIDNSFTFYDGSIYWAYNLESGGMIEIVDYMERRLVYSIYDNSYYEMKKRTLYRSIQDGTEQLLELSGSGFVYRVISFDKTGRFLFVEMVGSHEYHYLAAIDLAGGNIYEFDYSLMEGYELFMK